MQAALSLFLLFFLSAEVFAQPLEMTSSSPEHMSASVAVNTTVSFTFNTALNPYHLDQETITNFINVFPQNLISIEEIRFLDGNTTVAFDVIHEADTDYVWTLSALSNDNGEAQDRFQVVNYTTASTVSPYTISGTLSFINLPIFLKKEAKSNPLSTLMPDTSLLHARDRANFHHLVTSSVAAVDDPLNWGLSMVWLLDNLDWMDWMDEPVTDDPDWDDPDWDDPDTNSPEPFILNAGVTNPDTREYTIQNVRNGEYYLVALLTHPDYDYDLIAMGFYMDGEMDLQSVIIADESVTGIDIVLFGFLLEFAEATEAEDALERSLDLMTSTDPDARPIGLYGYDSAFDEYFYLKTASIPVPEPSGKSYVWEIIFLNDTESIVHVVNVAGLNAVLAGTISLTDLPPEDVPPVPLSEIKSIPDNFIPVLAALEVAKANNLDNLFAITDFDEWAYLEYSLSGFFFEYPGLLDKNSPVFWEILYEGYFWNTEKQYMDYFEHAFLVDAITGDFLGSVTQTGAEEQLVDQPGKIVLHQNYPNPFNPVTTIRWDMTSGQHVQISVYDMLGRHVAKLTDEIYPAGSHSVAFDASSLPSGVYLYRLDAGGVSLSSKMTVVK